MGQATDGCLGYIHKSLRSHRTYLKWMACRGWFIVAFLGRHGTPKQNTERGVPSSNSKCKAIEKTILSVLMAPSQYVSYTHEPGHCFVLSKNLGTFNSHDEECCPCHDHFKGLIRGCDLSGKWDSPLSAFQRFIFQIYALQAKYLGFARSRSVFFRSNR